MTTALVCLGSATALGVVFHDSSSPPAIDRWFQNWTASLSGQPGEPNFHYRVFWTLSRTERIGDVPLVILVAFVAGAVLALAATAMRDRLMWAAAPIVSLGLVGGVVEFLAKTLVNRHTVTNPAELYPSAHAAGTAAVAVCVGLALLRADLRRGLRTSARRIATWGFSLLSLAVGLSMAVLRGHFLTDVIGGWLLGAGAAAVVCLVADLTRPDVVGDARRG